MTKDWHNEAMHELRKGDGKIPLTRDTCYICNVVNGIDEPMILEETDDIIIFGSSVGLNNIKCYIFAWKKHVDYRTALKSDIIVKLFRKAAEYCEKIGMLSFKIVVDTTKTDYSTLEHAQIELFIMENQ